MGNTTGTLTDKGTVGGLDSESISTSLQELGADGRGDRLEGNNREETDRRRNLSLQLLNFIHESIDHEILNLCVVFIRHGSKLLAESCRSATSKLQRKLCHVRNTSGVTHRWECEEILEVRGHDWRVRLRFGIIEDDRGKVSAASLHKRRDNGKVFITHCIVVVGSEAGIDGLFRFDWVDANSTPEVLNSIGFELKFEDDSKVVPTAAQSEEKKWVGLLGNAQNLTIGHHHL